MLHFETKYAELFFVTFAIGWTTAALIFLRGAWRKDEEYEQFMPWSVRLLFYVIAYPILPLIGFGAALWAMRKSDAPHRKFAHASFFIAAVYLCFDAAVFLGMGIR